MDLNYILEWMTGVTSVAGIVRLLRFPSHGRTGWIVTYALGILLLLAGMLFYPDSAGYVAGAFLAVFLILPAFLFRFINRSMQMQEFARARRISLVVKWLHPADGMREYPELIRAYDLGKQGRTSEAEQLLMRYESHPGAIGRSAGIYLKRLRGDWEGLVQWCSSIPEASLVRSVDMLTTYVRGLGEVGRINDMMQAYSRFRRVLVRLPKNFRDLARLYVYSFAGRTDMVEKLLAGSLKQYPANIHEFWLGTSELAGGKTVEGRRRLEGLKAAGDPLVQRGVDLRLTRGVTIASTALIPPSVQVLEDDAKAYAHEERFEAAARSASRPFATYSLIAACAVMFAAEVVLGGATNGRALWRLGAMLPSLVAQGEWWRIVAAQFLHYGWVHLAMNMLALLLLGPFVERELGRLRYLVIYLLSGAGAMCTILFLASRGVLPDDFVVGASGSILGLIGASAALLLHAWIRHRAAVARRRLQSIILILALQTVFDLMTPQVSFTAHFSGALFGFVIAGAMILAAREGSEDAPEGGAKRT